MHFDGGVNIGNIISIAAAVFAAGMWAAKVSRGLEELRSTLEKHNATMEAFMLESKLDRKSIHIQMDRLARQKKARDDTGK